MDRVIMDMLGSDDRRLPVIEAARKLGRGATELSQIDVRGDSAKSVGVKSFNFPRRRRRTCTSSPVSSAGRSSARRRTSHPSPTTNVRDAGRA